MIAAAVIGVAPTPELVLAAGPKTDATATGFASILQAVVPGGPASPAQPEAQAPTPLQPADVDVPAIVDSVPEDVEPVAHIAKSPLPVPIVVVAASKSDCTGIVAQCGVLPSGLRVLAQPTGPAKNVPEKISGAAKSNSDDEPLYLDQFVSEPTGQLILTKPEFEQRVGEMPAAAPNPEKQAAVLQIAAPSPERIAVADALVPKLVFQVDRVEVQVSAPPEPRGPLLTNAPVADKSQPYLVERGPVFAPMLMQIARDVMALTADRDVRFNVRPDILGPVAVTIERTDAGPNLRLGVETQAAVQAVRAAEPLLNDSRGNVPFVQVTVDMNAPDQRSRQSRASVPPRRLSDQTHEILTERATVATGRYA